MTDGANSGHRFPVGALSETGAKLPGNGFFGGFESGVYFPTRSDIAKDHASWQGGAMVSYLDNGWNLTAAAFYGTGKEGLAGSPQWANVDLRRFTG